MVEVIETHSEDLARGLLEKILSSERMSDMNKVPRPELQQRVFEVYHNLRDWLVSKTDSDIERWYSAIGARRYSQGVRLSHLICAILAVKEHLWAFMRREVVLDRPMDIYQEFELFQMVDQFFDRAVYYTVHGYEQARSARST
jgi:acyl-ACP thioesterase